MYHVHAGAQNAPGSLELNLVPSLQPLSKPGSSEPSLQPVFLLTDVLTFFRGKFFEWLMIKRKTQCKEI